MVQCAPVSHEAAKTVEYRQALAPQSMNAVSETEELRARYRPSAIRVLFVGEAPPASGTFFYAQNSQVSAICAHHWRRAWDIRMTFCRHLSRTDFSSTIWFWNRWTIFPCGQRIPVFNRSVPLLARRIAEYRPQTIVTILKRIAPYVMDAHSRAGLDVPHFAVPFPGTGQQGNFARRMEEILPHLPLS